ncbi:TPA: tetratricopeptide repeat protein [Candidatus Poribacteria bacterium]|nr:tetratricopeptide repeat protein [Candidatus Poribacteria bacterium]
MISLSKTLKNVVFLTVLFAFFFGNISYGETPVSIYLRNGDRITGRWLNADNRTIEIEFNGQKMSVSLDEISHISITSNAVSEKYLQNAEDLLKLGLREQARKLFELSIQESPQNAKAYFRLAELFQEDGETDNAIKYFGLAAAVDPSYDLSEQFVLSATTYLSKGEFEKAAESYILLFENYPEHERCAYAGYKAAFLLAENVEAFGQALELLMQVTEKFPENPENEDYEKAQYLIGKLQVETNQAELAISTLTNFILTYTMSQWLPYAYTMRGRAFLELHQNSEAITDFTTAIEMTQDLRLQREVRQMRDSSAWMIYRVSDGLPSNKVKAIAADGTTVWVGTAKGLAEADTSSVFWEIKTEFTTQLEEMFEGSPLNIQSLAVDEEELWIGTMNHGVIRYNKTTGSIENYTQDHGLPHNLVYDIKIFGNEVWMGTFSGVAQYSRAADGWRIFNRETDELPADDIVALEVTPRTVWIGTSKSGVAFYDREFNYWRSYGEFEGLDSIVGNSIVSFDLVGNRLFFTWYNQPREISGYTECDLDSLGSHSEEVVRGDLDNLVRPENIHIAVTEDEVWLATNDGVYKNTRNTGDWDLIAYPEDRIGDPTVNSIEIGDSVAWIGTSNGLARINTSALNLREEELKLKPEEEESYE